MLAYSTKVLKKFSTIFKKRLINIKINPKYLILKLNQMFHINHYMVVVMYIINNFKIKCSMFSSVMC